MSEDLAGRLEVGLRRVEELDPAAPLPTSDPGLVARIEAEIAARGPMTFARFMELALYDPEAGYYTARSGAPPAADAPPGPAGSAAATGPGRVGDFLTAPESHPIFGWAVARLLESAWDAIGRPARFVVREHGAGTGALAAAVLDGLRRSGSRLSDAIRYQAIDVAPARLQALQDRLGAAGLKAALEPPDDSPEPGVVLANELLDALPVHRVEGGPDGTLLELFVVADAERPGTFTVTLGSPSTPALARRLDAEAVRLQPGQAAEICLVLDAWVARAAGTIERGLLLVVDYGRPAAELYAPERGSTLRAYHRHRVHADPFVAVGHQDLTAHVDLTALERAASEAGLEPVGRARQAEWLVELGAGDLLVAIQDEPGITMATYLAARSALVRMLDPRATGAFAVRAFGRGLPPGARIRGFPAPGA